MSAAAATAATFRRRMSSHRLPDRPLCAWRLPVRSMGPGVAEMFLSLRVRFRPSPKSLVGQWFLPDGKMTAHVRTGGGACSLESFIRPPEVAPRP